MDNNNPSSGASGAMKRIGFLNGQVLNDYHLNILQTNIAESMKDKLVQERYDLLMLVSPYNHYLSESFVSDSNRTEESTAIRDTLNFSISQGTWISKLWELPEAVDELCVYSSFEENRERQSYVDFYYRTSEANEWIEIKPDMPVVMQTAQRYVQMRIDCRYTGVMRPVVYDYAFMVKEREG